MDSQKVFTIPWKGCNLYAFVRVTDDSIKNKILKKVMWALPDPMELYLRVKPSFDETTLCNYYLNFIFNWHVDILISSVDW